MNTVTPSTGQDRSASSRITREVAMKFFATGRTADEFRRHAASPETVAGLSAGSGETPDAAQTLLLALADGIDKIVAEGLTFAECWDILGWDLGYVEALIRSQDGDR